MLFKRLNIMSQLEKLIILVILILAIQLKKLIITHKLAKSKIKLLPIILYITTQEFNELTSKNVAARLKQANLASKTDIPDITNFARKILIIN